MKQISSALLFSLVTAAALVGCKKEASTSSKPAVTAPGTSVAPTAPGSADPAPTAPAAGTPAGIPAGTYGIDNVHSALLFKARHMGAGHTYGWFKDFAGSMVVDADLSKMSIELTAKADSIDTNNKMRDEHLRGPDFFNTAQFGELKFKSTKVEAGAGGALAVTGDLTIHGVTKSVTAQVTALGHGEDPKKNIIAGFETTLVIKRSDFDIKFMPGALGEDVTLIVAIEGTKK